ncbi:hypothetical protein P167DRAFT_578659 [Morchella conica CCBAS932]|uniref:NACHT domain-containing protein n=1 Tax=Morchella conica CCBAS932 TaxID=1392247 RepID=A0A3N4KQQ0_9PEZI|nr:hypothetical protein P167DRAFT_578659 [Morchella conica CCBAS932]
MSSRTSSGTGVHEQQNEQQNEQRNWCSWAAELVARSSIPPPATAAGTDVQPLSLPQPAVGVKHSAGSSTSARSSGTGISAAPASTLSPESSPAPHHSAPTPPHTRNAQTPLESSIDRSRATAQIPERQSSTFTAGRASLWDNARVQLPEKIQEKLCSVDQCDINLVKFLIETIQVQKEACDEKRWSYVNTAGQKVFYFESLIEQLNKYALIGDIAIQHNPDIVVLAWSGFRFLLQVSFTLDGHPNWVGTAYTENMRSIADSFSTLMRVVCCCDIYERLYTSKDLTVTEILTGSIVKLYVSILDYLFFTTEHLQKGTTKQVWDSFFPGSKQKLGDLQTLEKTVIANAEVAEKEAADAGRSDNTEQVKNLKLLLSQMQTPLTEIELVVKKLFASVESERYLKILIWFSQMPFASHHAYFSKHRRHATGDWLLEHQKYGKWKMSDESSIFWLRGGPGCGKSYLASKVIDHVLDEVKMDQHKWHHAVAYFYYHYNNKGKNDPGTILRTIVKQLCLSMGDGLLPKEVLSIYEEREKQGHPSSPLDVDECRNLTIKLCNGFPQTTIILDALDECDEKERRSLFYALSEIAKGSRLTKIFVTGRDIEDIRDTLSGHSSHWIEETDNQRDVNLFIQTEIERRSQPHAMRGVEKPLLGGKDVPQQFKDQVIRSLQSKANGMFMWVQFQIEAICKESTMPKVLRALETLPESLDTTYERIIEKINST